MLLQVELIHKSKELPLFTHPHVIPNLLFSFLVHI